MTAGDLAQRIDAIERGYEYLLAYAAQGRREEAGSEVRSTLERIYAALDELGPLARTAIGAEPTDYDCGAFLDALDRDARIARSAIGLALSRPQIGSLLVDNLNASVHLRALLTDLFFLDQALKAQRAG